MKFVQEKRLISKFFDEISQASNKYVFGVKDTLTCLEMGAVETLIVWENFDVNRYVVLKPTGASDCPVTVYHWSRDPIAASQSHQWYASSALHLPGRTLHFSEACSGTECCIKRVLFVCFAAIRRQCIGCCFVGETEVLHLTKAQEESEETFRDKETGSDLEVQEKQSLLEWFANNYKQVGHHHESVTHPTTHCVVLYHWY